VYHWAVRYTLRTPSCRFSNESFVLTNSLQQSLCRDTNSSAARQEVPNILWNLKGHYSVHNIHILTKIGPVHILSSYSTKIHFDTILPCLPSGPFPLGFHTKTLYTPLLSPHT